jgi:hypothetical protein
VSSPIGSHSIDILLKHIDTHEGAEAPLVGVVGAFGSLLSSISIDTAEFSRRLQRQPRNIYAKVLQSDDTNDEANEIDPSKGITAKQFHHLAYRMAVKSYEDDPYQNLTKPRNRPAIAAVRTKVAVKQAKGGRVYQVANATMHYACDLATTGARGGQLEALCPYSADSVSKHQLYYSITLRTDFETCLPMLSVTTQPDKETK